MTNWRGKGLKVAIVSEDFRTLSGKAGKARRFLLFEARKGRRPQLERYLEVPADRPTYHDLHEDDETLHPIDGMVLIASGAGEGLGERLARRGTTLYITRERDPHTAVSQLLQGTLPLEAPNAAGACRCG
jgi:predicted Fe-Mo cluster-binding NifX family protein